MSSTSSPPTDTPPTSNAQASTPQTPPHVQALQLLTTRLDAFDHDLQSAINSEHNFHSSLRALSASLDSLITAHRFETEHLSRLIAIDTQRSQQARDEYEMLAARFREAMGGGEGGFGWEVIRIVWLYVGIGLSVVMMAPLHLVLYVVEGVMWRLGWRSNVEEKKTRGRGREGGRGGRREGVRKGRRGEGGAGRSEDRYRASDSKGASVEGSAAARLQQREPLGVEVGLSKAGQGDVGNFASSSEDEDEFFDAMCGEAGEAGFGIGDEFGGGQLEADGDEGSGKGSIQEGEEDAGREEGESEEIEVISGNGEDGKPRRPEWAIPQESGRMEMGNFPSNDFWELPKDDDMYMSFLKGN